MKSLPTLEDLVTGFDKSYEQNALTVLLNQHPPTSWLKAHPMAKMKDESGKQVAALYLPIDKVEYLLTRIYVRHWVEVKSVQVHANSEVVIVRLFVINPVTLETEFNDGVGAAPIQTDSGAAATDWTKVKSSGVQMAAPSAETYAIKDAAEKFGRVFGRDLTRINLLDYDSLLKSDSITVETLKEKLDEKYESLPAQTIIDIRKIIDTKSEKDYKRVYKILTA